jgi:hypothetical protein
LVGYGRQSQLLAAFAAQTGIAFPVSPHQEEQASFVPLAVVINRVCLGVDDEDRSLAQRHLLDKVHDGSQFVQG